VRVPEKGRSRGRLTATQNIANKKKQPGRVAQSAACVQVVIVEELQVTKHLSFSSLLFSFFFFFLAFLSML